MMVYLVNSSGIGAVVVMTTILKLRQNVIENVQEISVKVRYQLNHGRNRRTDYLYENKGVFRLLGLQQ